MTWRTIFPRLLAVTIAIASIGLIVEAMAEHDDHPPRVETQQ